MLKKAGIVVAATAASLVAASPLAFATEHGDVDVTKQVNSISDASSQIGLVNVGDVDALNNVGVAAPINLNAVLGILGTATGTQGTGPIADLGGLGDSIVQSNED